MANADELELALAYPGEKWSVFLHPAQRELVDRKFAGPARGAGSAGTGKTVVALHRAVQLARSNLRAKVLLTTFSIALARMLRQKLRQLGGHTFSDRFFEQEWTDVVDAWQLRTWESYRDVARLGRRSRLTEKQRASIWPIFEHARQRLHDGALVTLPVVYREIGDEVTRSKEQPFGRRR